MLRSPPQRSVLLVALLAGLLSGCAAWPPAPADDQAAVLLRGTSSTFAASAYLRWFNQLAVHEAINAEIESVGSGQSIRAFLGGGVSFAGTDSPPSAQEIGSARRGLLAFPVTAGAIAVAYNLPGCDLRLSRSQLADLFLGRLVDFAQLGCRRQPITVLHRADASGSTANFTASLAAFSDAWRDGPGVGRQVRWPAGQPVQGSDAMALALAATPGSVGYIESAYIRPPLQAAALQNRQGQLLRPTAAAAAQALASIPLDRRLLGTNPDPPSGYPIVNLNWMLVPARDLGERREPLRTSLTYILSRAGQDDAELLGYVPLPLELRRRALDQLSRLGR
jgi:phosphate transport system substrate-binding protein